MLAVRDETGQPLLDAVGEVELAFCDELEHNGRDVALGQARDLEVVARVHRRLVADVAQSARQPQRTVAVADKEDRARNARGDELVDALLERRSPRVLVGRGTCRRGRREQRGREAGEERGRNEPAEPHVIVETSHSVSSVRLEGRVARAKPVRALRVVVLALGARLSPVRSPRFSAVETRCRPVASRRRNHRIRRPTHALERAEELGTGGRREPLTFGSSCAPDP